MTTYGENQFKPGVTSDVFSPDQLIAGAARVVTASATITGGADLTRGTVLGQVLLGAVTSAAKSGGNTGNGTCVPDASTPLLANAMAGIYSLRCTVAGTNSATFRLKDPRGRVLGDYSLSGSGGSVTTDAQIKAAITDGATDFVVGDGFDITVADSTSLNKYKKAVSTAVDGSAEPAAILADNSTASGGDVNGGIYVGGDGFNSRSLTIGSGLTLAGVTASLRKLGIYVRTAVSNADPT